MPNQNPCYQCLDREIDCHSKCTKYLIWKEEQDERKRIDLQGKSAVYGIQRDFQARFKRFNSASSYHKRGK